MRLSKQYSCVVKGDTARKCMQLVKNVTSRIAQFSPVLASGVGLWRKMRTAHMAKLAISRPGGRGEAGGGTAARLIAAPMGQHDDAARRRAGTPERPLASQRKMSKEWLAGSHPLPGVVEPALGGAPWPYWPGC